jgi:hypothetical protein
MGEDATPAVPAWYWIVGGVAFLWEATGCFFYVVQVRMGPAELAQLPPAQAEAFASMAIWQWAAFATAVWVGLLGAIGLLLRRRWASLGFWVSLIAAAVQYGYTFFATPILERMPASEALPLPIAILVLGLVFVWFAGFAANKGWLR